MNIQIKTVTKKLNAGEGPHWDEETQALYFVDLLNSSIHRYHPASGSHTHVKIIEANNALSMVIPVKGEANKFFITFGCTMATVVWDGVSETVSEYKVLQTLVEENDMRLNDGKISPSGILLAGTMEQEVDLNNMDLCRGHLYSFKGLIKKKLLDGVSLSNGLAWSHDESMLYYNDSPKYRVDGYQYDKGTTELHNRKTIFNFKTHNINAIPDGMTIDADEHLWVACLGSGQVLNIDPQNGKLLRSVQFPAMCITSVAFGGPNFEDLYVTSADGIIKDLPPNPEDGCTFVVTGTGVRGLPANKIQL